MAQRWRSQMEPATFKEPNLSQFQGSFKQAVLIIP